MPNSKWTFVFLTLSLVICSFSALAGDSPFDVADKAQLFVDQVLVHDSENVHFKMHAGKRHSQNPLITVDRSWEGWRLELYGTVLFDEEEQLFKMWYLASNGIDQSETYVTCYATSEDGLHWTKPLLKEYLTEAGEPTNIVAECHLASVIKDNKEADPSRRYKMLCHIDAPKPEGGPQTMVSPDGIHWTRLSKTYVVRSSDVLTGYFDRQRQQYVAIPKLVTKHRDHIRRCFGLSISQDFLTWSEPYYIFKPDLRDDASSLARIEEVRSLLDVPDAPDLMRTEFYGAGVYQAESCTVGFPWVFTINNDARYGNHEGPSEIQLAVTRDLVTWERPFRTPVVPRGKPGQWDSGFFTTPAEAILVNDEVRLYYSACNFTHGNPCLYRAEGTGRLSEYTGSIGLVTWKRDRFVSAKSGELTGSLKTVPVVFSGDRLELNIQTKPKGSVVVHLHDSSGLLLAESIPVSGDHLRAPVDFPDFDISKYAGQPVYIRFQMNNCDLYSFAFRNN
ncbi:hypothetical protein [Polystyrenella longa]|nr:hypothetical protein [Polystyrenella longa]